MTIHLKNGITALALRLPPSLAIVVPCYNEEEVLPETARRLTTLIDHLVAGGRIAANPEIFFVDDGSRDRTWSMIERLNQADRRLRGVKLSRNRGHQNALMAGLAATTSDVVVTIDADLQDDPEVIGAMVDAYREGADIALGVRSDRSTDSIFKRVTGRGFYQVMAALGVEIVYDHADFRLLSRRAVNALADYTESNLFLRALIPQLGFTTAMIPYRRAERFAGESKYPLGKMLAFALDGVTSFSTRPLRIITLLGFLVSSIAFALGIWALFTALYLQTTVPGWASITVPIYVICGVQLLCLGIIGEYIGKIYFETKRRPRFVVERTLNGPEDERAREQKAKRNDNDHRRDARDTKVPMFGQRGVERREHAKADEVHRNERDGLLAQSPLAASAEGPPAIEYIA